MYFVYCRWSENHLLLIVYSLLSSLFLHIFYDAENLKMHMNFERE